MHISQHPPAKSCAISTSEEPAHPANKDALATRLLVRSNSDRPLTTDELAAELGISAQSIRKRYSQTGTYFGLRPVKLPNRRLLWPSDSLAQLMNR